MSANSGAIQKSRLRVPVARRSALFFENREQNRGVAQAEEAETRRRGGLPEKERPTAVLSRP